MRKHVIENWDKGLVNRFEDRSIPENAASNSLNWLTLNDRIELSGGYGVVGTEQGAGRVTGLHIAPKVDGTKQPFVTYARKVLYRSASTLDWVEIGTNTLAAAADGEDVSFASYVSSAGYQTWLSSPNSSMYKIMNANPANIKDLYNSSKNFKGYITANERILLWFRDKFKTILYGSYKDVQNTVVYTTVTNEAIGALGSTTYSGTLSTVTGKRTCFNVVIDDGTQTVQDDKNGNLVGDGTGTINYATGAYSVTFNAVTTGAVTSDYQWEDSTAKGVADFTFSGTRLATEGFFLPQPTGGDLLAVLAYKTGSTTDYYCLHENETWIFSMPIDDLSPSNQIFRVKVGIKNWRAAVATGDGVYYLDTADPSDPKLKLLTLIRTNNQVEPVEISFNVNLSGANFEQGLVYEWGNYIVWTCKEDGEDHINRMYAFHKQFKTIDRLKYLVSCVADNDGELWAGSSLTNSVWKLFSGFSANGSIIENYWEGKLSKQGIDELKKTKRLTIRGQIATDQVIRVSALTDDGEFVVLGDIEGDGSYVTQEASIVVGSPQVGSHEVGGGSDGITANNYIREFRLSQLVSKYDEMKLRFEALGAGYASVSTVNFHDIKTYGQKNLRRFRETL
jgi:hypothetical protein